jgi:hypothetical protein
VSTPPEELLPLYQQAALRPAVFKAIFDTYHGDSVTRAKLKQRAADLKVHPDETESCVDTYVSSLELAGLVTVDGDQVRHSVANSISNDVASAGLDEENGDDSNEGETRDEGNQGTYKLPSADKNGEMEETGRPRAVFNVNVTLDSSLDTEKLQKQLELLKRFGAI